MTEEWAPVVGFEGLYEVSSAGRVKGLSRRDSLGRAVPERILRPNPVSAGYMAVDLFKAGRRKMSLVHRLVARAFLENPLGLPQVNHLDGSKDNNSKGNLEWSSPRDNVIHAMHTLGRESGPCARRRVEALRGDSVVLSFVSSQASRAHGFDPASVSKCCRGRAGTHRGLSWRFAA